MEIRASKTAESARSFLKNLIEKVPFKISKALTDNGKEFTDRFCVIRRRDPTENMYSTGNAWRKESSTA